MGAGFVAVPFVKSWNPSERAKAAGAPAKVDTSKIEPGAMVVAEWRCRVRGKTYRANPVAVGRLKRGAQRPSNSNRLSNPLMPTICTARAKPELSVILGVCTHLGCAPKYHPEVKPEPFDADWKAVITAHATVHVSICQVVCTAAHPQRITWLFHPIPMTATASS